MAKNALLAAYAVVGVDQLKRQTAIRRLKGRLEPGLEAFNLDERTAGSDLSATDLRLSLETLAMGNGFRLVLIHEANKLPKSVSEMIVTYLQDPNPGCVLCLEAETLNKGTRLYKAVAALGRQAVISCDAIKPRDLPAYVIRLAASLGVTMDHAAAQELVSRVGDDTTMLERSIRSLGEMHGAMVTQAHVEASIARTAEVKPWEFLDKVAAGDARRALELYRSMQNPSHLALLALLTSRVRELICARAFIDRGEPQRVASELGRQEWQIRSTVNSARRFSGKQLVSCLEACARCERELKGGYDAEASFVGLVLQLCEPK